MNSDIPSPNCKLGALEYLLDVEMQNNYAIGNANASLFATEGIASVKMMFAPLAVFVCGLIIALV